jgi:tripartite-type tricarboxylate transporter receptor subunit TctC
VPYSPGGGTDIVGRALAQEVGKALQQQIVVENRAGANGNIGMEFVAKAEPDGYTILFSTSSLAINPSVYKGLPYDPVKDFSPIALATVIPFILVVHTSLPTASAKELIALARARPRQLAYSSSGAGNATHLAMALFEMMAKVHMNHVPYKGTGQALSDLMGGHVQLMFGAIPSTYPAVKAGKLRVLAISSARRSATLPEVPTVAEAALPGYELTSWYGALAPAGTAEAIVTRLNAEIVKALSQPEVVARLSKMGADPAGNAPAEFQAYIKSETQKYAKIVGAVEISR